MLILHPDKRLIRFHKIVPLSTIEIRKTLIHTPIDNMCSAIEAVGAILDGAGYRHTKVDAQRCIVGCTVVLEAQVYAMTREEREAFAPVIGARAKSLSHRLQIGKCTDGFERFARPVTILLRQGRFEEKVCRGYEGRNWQEKHDGSQSRQSYSRIG
jgi:hypothetical protein